MRTSDLRTNRSNHALRPWYSTRQKLTFLKWLCTEPVASMFRVLTTANSQNTGNYIVGIQR